MLIHLGHALVTSHMGASTFKLLFALFISGIAQGMTLVAIPWYMTSHLELTKEWSFFYIGMTALVIPWTFIAGRIVDRFPKKYIFIIENILAGGMLLWASFYAEQEPQVAFVAPMVFAWNYFFFNIHYPALYAYIQALHSHDQHMNVVSWIEVQGQISNMLGGGLAAILLGAGELSELIPASLEAWTLKDVFFLDGVTYFVALFLITGIEQDRAHPENTKEALNFLPVLNFVRTHRYVFLIGFFSYFVFAATLVEGFYGSAVYNDVYFEGSAVTYSLAGVAFGVGALLSGSSLPRLKTYISIRVGLLVMMSIAALGFVFGALWISPMAYIGAIFLVGIGNAGTRVFRTTFLMEHVPNHIFGRVANIYTILNLLLRITLLGIFTIDIFTSQPLFLFLFLGFICFIGALGIIRFMFRTTINEIFSPKDVTVS